MTRISAADQLLALLRAQLERREKQRRKTTQRQGSARETQSPISRLREITSASDVPRPALERVMVQALLAEELGEAAINDPSFQTMLETVHKRIASDPQASDMLRRAVEELLTPEA